MILLAYSSRRRFHPHPPSHPGAYRRVLMPTIELPPCYKHSKLGAEREGFATLLQDQYRVLNVAMHKV